MAVGDRTYQWAAHTAWGYPFNFLQNVIEHTFGYTANNKVAANAAAGAVLGSTAGTTGAQTITAGITQPDVPRVLAVTLGGSGFSADTLQIVGVNVEGKPITDTITYTSSTGQVNGALVFKRVTSLVLKGSLGTSATVTVDTTNKLGLNHRCPPTFTTAIVIHDSAPSNTGSSVTKPTLEAAPSSSNFDGQFVEKNWVQPATAPNGTNFQYFFYWFHKALVYPPKDSPEFYSTTTSTSTSSTSTSTSTSSTSTSISTSSTSVSTTSTSTSSTSTSTTTLPV